MLRKSHALALAAATAGLIGFSATMASAATLPTVPHVPANIVKVASGQLPAQLCDKNGHVNVTGAHLPAGDALVAGLLSSGAITKTTSVSQRVCDTINVKSLAGGQSASGVVNAVPAQACGSNALGDSQVPLTGFAGALSFLSPAAVAAPGAVGTACGLAGSQSLGH
jgi:hypothetical protein